MKYKIKYLLFFLMISLTAQAQSYLDVVDGVPYGMSSIFAFTDWPEVLERELPFGWYKIPKLNFKEGVAAVGVDVYMINSEKTSPNPSPEWAEQEFFQSPFERLQIKIDEEGYPYEWTNESSSHKDSIILKRKGNYLGRLFAHLNYPPTTLDTVIFNSDGLPMEQLYYYGTKLKNRFVYQYDEKNRLKEFTCYDRKEEVEYRSLFQYEKLPAGIFVQEERIEIEGEKGDNSLREIVEYDRRFRRVSEYYKSGEPEFSDGLKMEYEYFPEGDKIVVKQYDENENLYTYKYEMTFNELGVMTDHKGYWLGDGGQDDWHLFIRYFTRIIEDEKGNPAIVYLFQYSDFERTGKVPEYNFVMKYVLRYEYR